MKYEDLCVLRRGLAACEQLAKGIAQQLPDPSMCGTDCAWLAENTVATIGDAIELVESLISDSSLYWMSNLEGGAP